MTPTTTGWSCLRLEISRILSAPRPVVFGALSEPDELAKWWGPHGFAIPALELDLRVGGSYRIAMEPPDGAPFYLSGEFRDVSPPARLAYTFRWEEPDPDDQETLVSLSLEDLGDSTELVLDQGPFATKARHALHQQGWTESFEKLAELLPPDRSHEQ